MKNQNMCLKVQLLLKPKLVRQAPTQFFRDKLVLEEQRVQKPKLAMRKTLQKNKSNNHGTCWVFYLGTQQYG